MRTTKPKISDFKELENRRTHPPSRTVRPTSKATQLLAACQPPIDAQARANSNAAWRRVGGRRVRTREGVLLLEESALLCFAAR